MSIFQISYNNIKRNFKNYLLYFIAILFSSFTLYTVNLIYLDKTLAEITPGMSLMFLGGVVVTFIAYSFINSANRLFREKRRQEIGMYNLLGITKSKIGVMFIYEGFIISIVGILLGTVLATIFSKLFIMLLLKLMRINMIVHISFNIYAFAISSIIILIISLFSSISNYVYVKKTELIKLFKKERESQGLNKWLMIKGIAGIALILGGYALSISKQCNLYNVKVLFIVLCLVVIGTELFFKASLPILIKAVRKVQSYYYRGTNLVAISEIKHRSKSNADTLAGVTVLIATAVTALGVTYSLYFDLEKRMEETYNFTDTIIETSDEINNEVDNIVTKYKDLIDFDQQIEFKKVEGRFSYKFSYAWDGESDADFDVISESEYKKVRDYEQKTAEPLKSNNDVYLFEESTMTRMMTTELDKPVKFNDGNMEFNIVAAIKEPLLNQYINSTVIVVKDEVYNNLEAKEVFKIRCIDSKNNNKKLDKEIVNLYQKHGIENEMYNRKYSSYNQEYDYQYQFQGVTLFIGILLSLLLVIATGSLIFNKQIGNIFENKERFLTLRKIGANENHISKILFKETRIIFLVPIILGTIHSIFAVRILSDYLGRSIIQPVLITLIIFYFAYGIFYLSTVAYSSKLLRG